MESAITKTKFRSGYVAVTGRPNVGKSTITNALIGAKVAIVSNKPGTTRTRIQGIMHGESSQIVFVDTPGLAIPQGKLGAFMQSEAKAALDGIDALLVVVQAGHIIEIDKHILDRFRSLPIKKVIAVNKTDSVSPEKLAAALSDLDITGYDECVPISAKSGRGLSELKEILLNMMPEGPEYFPDDMITDQPVRNMCAEIIREQALTLLRYEIPYGIGVEIQKITKLSDKLTEIFANIYVEKDGHKRIVIGSKGSMLQKIGSQARLAIEELMETHVSLQLWVKVREDWRNRTDDLRTLGYTSE